MRLRLDEDDAAKLGCEQVLSLDLAAIGIADLDELAARFEFDPDDWPHPLVGEIAFEDAGNPDAKPKRPRWQKQAAVWIAVRGSGVDITWEQAGRVQAMKTVYLPDEDAPGKDEDPSESSEASTTGLSESSTD